MGVSSEPENRFGKLWMWIWLSNCDGEDDIRDSDSVLLVDVNTHKDKHIKKCINVQTNN